MDKDVKKSYTPMLLATLTIAAQNSTVDLKKSKFYAMMGLTNPAVENNLLAGRDRHGLPRKRKKGSKLRR